MEFGNIQVGAKVQTNVLGGIIKTCTVLDLKSAGESANWTQSQGAVLKLRVDGSKGRTYIVRSADQVW
jgi:hypothetical protein